MSVAVEISPDFERIRRLPTREISEERGWQLSRELSPMLLSEEGKRHPVWSKGLNWLQALAIDEAVQQDGAYLQLPVGSGKTLLTWLFAYIFDARRPVLVVPESLIEKTHIEFQDYARFWKRPANRPKVIGLKALTQEKNVNMLRDRYRADLYLLDEVDMLKNQDSSMVKRLARDISDRDVRTIAMTGTGGRFSIKDITHMLCWALKEGAPVPLDAEETEWWADALDERKKFTFGAGSKRRTEPGVLLDLIEFDAAEEDPDNDLEDETQLARAIFRKRLTYTPGVIISDTDSCKQPLSIELAPAPYDRAIEQAFKLFRSKGETPQGDVITDAIEAWMIEDALGCGHCPRWVDPPPDWWADARRDYFKLCQKVIRQTAWSDNPKDTPNAVKRAFPKHPAVQEWFAVKDEWEGERETHWHSSSVLEWAARWADRNHGIIWTKSIAFGDALSRLTGLAFYGAEGRDRKGRSVERDGGADPIICSVASNSRGRNLQDRWSNNLLVGGVQSARANEQLLGRTHRYGQTEAVRALILLTSGGSMYSFKRALQEARFVYQTQGHRQKLLRAQKKLCELPRGESRWSAPGLKQNNRKAA